MIERLILWIILFYIVYRVLKAVVGSAVNKGIRDYETRKKEQQRKEKEIKVDRKNVEDAEFKDL
jgi:hypothetical protein